MRRPHTLALLAGSLAISGWGFIIAQNVAIGGLFLILAILVLVVDGE